MWYSLNCFVGIRLPGGNQIWNIVIQFVSVSDPYIYIHESVCVYVCVQIYTYIYTSLYVWRSMSSFLPYFIDSQEGLLENCIKLHSALLYAFAGHRQSLDDAIKTLLSVHSYINVSLQLPKQKKWIQVCKKGQVYLLWERIARALQQYFVWQSKHIMSRITIGS